MPWYFLWQVGMKPIWLFSVQEASGLRQRFSARNENGKGEKPNDTAHEKECPGQRSFGYHADQEPHQGCVGPGKHIDD